MTFAANEPTPKADTPEARQYNRIRRRLGVLDFLLGLALLVILLATGWTNTLRDWAYLGAGQRYALAVFFYVGMLAVLTKVLGFGLDYYSFRLEHRYALSNQRLGGWLRDQFKGWLIGLLLATIVVESIYWTIRISPGHWWLIAWAGFVLLSVFFAQIAPVLLFPVFYKFEPLQDEDLRQRLLRLCERAGTRVRGVYEWKLSEKSKKANAALAGLGRTRRIIISDTLLQNYSAEEIEAVMAHELGHHVHRHVPKGIGVQMGISFFGFWATAALLRYVVFDLRKFDGLSDFANLPVLALVSTVMSFALLPALNAYSRYNERQADRYCFQALPSVAPFITSMEKLADQNLAERRPSRLVELLFHSHPAIARRIEAALGYARQHQQSGFVLEEKA
jgi:STE24 endopeptidase